MIILPTRRRLERRRDELYRHLGDFLPVASIIEVEGIMRRIHCINLKLRTYFIKEGQNETTELFEDKDTLETEEPTFLQIEEAIGEIEI